MATRTEPAALAAIGSLPKDTIQWAIAAGLRSRNALHTTARVELGNGTAVRIFVAPLTTPTEKQTWQVDSGGMFIAAEGWGAYAFQPTGVLESGYVSSKLSRGNQCDGAALALLIGVALDRQAYVTCACAKHLGAGRMAARG